MKVRLRNNPFLLAVTGQTAKLGHHGGGFQSLGQALFRFRDEVDGIRGRDEDLDGWLAVDRSEFFLLNFNQAMNQEQFGDVQRNVAEIDGHQCQRAEHRFDFIRIELIVQLHPGPIVSYRKARCCRLKSVRGFDDPFPRDRASPIRNQPS